MQIEGSTEQGVQNERSGCSQEDPRHGNSERRTKGHTLLNSEAVFEEGTTMLWYV